MTQYVLLAIRWAAAGATAYAASLLVHVGLHLTPDMVAFLTAAIVTAVTPLYYKLIAELEKQFPWLGHLLIVRNPKAATAPPAPVAKK